MKHSSIPAAQLVVQHCQARGIKNIVISPGSRNAPLILGFTENSYFKCYSIVDERAAAFFALGIAQQLQQPVAIVCSSGSALLNYYPAIAEAFYSYIPLVAISADRPSYKIDVGDGQTIRQDNVFDRHIGYSANLKQDVNHATDRIEKYAPELVIHEDITRTQETIEAHNNDELNKSLETAILKRLPIHINVPFEEPLYNTLAKLSVQAQLKPLTTKVDTKYSLDAFVEQWNNAKRKMVLVGVHQPNKIEKAHLEILGNDPSVMVFTESTSNIHHPNFFPSIDSIIAPIEKSKDKDKLFKNLQPELLLTFGGLIVSKKIKSFLRDYKPQKHWHVDSLNANDTFFALNQHFKMDIAQFLSFLIPHNKKVESDYFSSWNEVKKKYEQERAAYIKQIPFSDFSAFESICRHIPPKCQVQLANSSTVRYMQLFDINEQTTVFCNRGTSGIDGSTSTAVGASLVGKNPTLLITGDLSFLYDSNALWNNYIKSDFKIILINNEGGGIFRILPGKEDSSNFETYFETTQEYDVSHLCKMYEFDYFKVDNQKELENILPDFFKNKNQASLLEISTPRIKNDKILMSYFDFIS